MTKQKIVITIIFIILIAIIITLLIIFRHNIFYQPTTFSSNINTSKKQYPPENFTVAFIGDQGYGENTKAVLQLIKDEGADMVLHQGDFDCQDDPDKWDSQINEVLGNDFPFFASVGNHDVKEWSGYQQRLIDRLNRIEGENCTGDIGVNAACTYQGIFFVLSGIGTLGSGHVSYLQEQLASSEAAWEICSWHKNQKLMQVGDKPNEVGWEAYDTCREQGAIIVTGHEHSYSRTYLMSNFENQEIASISSILEIEKGKTFAVVSGLGGKSIRVQNDELASNPWWASIYTADQNANHGALFCKFNTNKASCYFKDIDGNVPDQFDLVVNKPLI